MPACLPVDKDFYFYFFGFNLLDQKKRLQKKKIKKKKDGGVGVRGKESG